MLEILIAVQLVPAHTEALPEEWTRFEKLDAFFFAVLKKIHALYQEDNIYLDSLIGEKTTDAPIWDNFNLHQQEQHLKQLRSI
jgi:hypothetical protein